MMSSAGHHMAQWKPIHIIWIFMKKCWKPFYYWYLIQIYKLLWMHKAHAWANIPYITVIKVLVKQKYHKAEQSLAINITQNPIYTDVCYKHTRTPWQRIPYPLHHLGRAMNWIWSKTRKYKNLHTNSYKWIHTANYVLHYVMYYL